MRAQIQGILCMAILAAAPRLALAQACSGPELVLEQVGQDVQIAVTDDGTSEGGDHTGTVRRVDEGGSVEAEIPYSIPADSCLVWMPEPANQCGCYGGTVSVIDECVPAGTYTYDLGLDDAGDPIGWQTIAVSDTGDDCLPAPEEDEGCSAAGRGAGELALPWAVAALLLLAARPARRSRRA